MASGPQVGVVGMSALRRDIRRLTDDQQSQLYRAIREAGRAAAEPVAGRARSRTPQDTGALVGSIRTTATRTGAAVRMGGAKQPYAPWIEFGGTRPDGSTRYFLRNGRYLFPAAVNLGPVSADTYARAIGAVFSNDSVWTNTTSDPGAVHD